MTELVERAMAGDAEAFIELAESCKQSLYKVARGFLSEPMDIDDAVADTVMTCWERIGTLRSPEYFKTWLVRIMINKCSDILRARKRTVSLECVGEETRGVSGDMSARLDFESLVDMLDERCRAIFVLYYSEGFSISEISGLLGVPVGTVGSRLKRGREQLRSILEKGGV